MRTGLRAYQEGLREPLRLLIKASRYTTLKDAIEGAIIEGRSCPSISVQKSPQNSNKYCSFCKKTNHNYSECRYRSTIKCANCGKLGHSANHCRVKTNKSTSLSVPTEQNHRRINNITLTCKYCKRVGHEISNCFRRKNVNNRKNYSNNSENQPRQGSQSFETAAEQHQ